MKTFLTKSIGWLAGCLLALTLCTCGGDEAESIDLKAIRDCKELEVAEFHFHKIIVERNLSWYRLEKTLILPVDVKVVGKIDFSDITEENLIRQGDGLVFVLPEPTLLIDSLWPDYETRGRASRENWYRGGSFSNEDIKKIANQAKDSIMTGRTIRLMTERTRANAATILIPILSTATGVPEENITVRFDSDLNLAAPELIRDSNKDAIIFRRKE